MTTIEKLEKQIEELKAEVERLKNEEALKRTEHYYFLSEDSAECFLSAVEELKVLQHYHDIYCPNFIPNWNDENEEKWYIVFSTSTKKYCYDYSFIEYRTTIYFDSEETVRKVCDRLNENL